MVNHFIYSTIPGRCNDSQNIYTVTYESEQMWEGPYRPGAGSQRPILHQALTPYLLDLKASGEGQSYGSDRGS